MVKAYPQPLPQREGAKSPFLCSKGSLEERLERYKNTYAVKINIYIDFKDSQNSK